MDFGVDVVVLMGLAVVLVAAALMLFGGPRR